MKFFNVEPKRIIKTIVTYSAFMAIGLGLGYAGSRLPAMLKPNYQTGNYAAYMPEKNIKVAVYGTAWCKFCQKTRGYLKDKKISFSDLDIESSAQAAQLFKKMGGDGAVPVVLIGNRRINGYMPEQFEAALQELQSVAR